MRRASLLVVAVLLPFAVVTGCKKQQQQVQQPYPPQGQYPTAQPTAYPTAQPTAYPTAQPTAYPTAQPTATTGVALSNPGPLALPCQSDATCVTSKCHPQFQKCVMPCTNDNDCIAPNKCILGTGLCVPSLGTMGAPAQ